MMSDTNNNAKGKTMVATTLKEAIHLLAEHADDDTLIVDPEGNELFPDGHGGVIYSDGASAACYGPLSS